MLVFVAACPKKRKRVASKLCTCPSDALSGIIGPTQKLMVSARARTESDERRDVKFL